MVRDKDIQRFLTYVSKSDGCWMWTGGRTKSGYGAFNIYGRRIDAHRFAFLAFRGTIPVGIHVCHECDVPGCVNPAHLFLGTHSDNMKDAARKGRMVYPDVWSSPEWRARHLAATLKGQDVKSSKMTDDQVLQLRKERLTGMSSVALARKYNIDKSTVLDILNGEIWKHVFAMDGCPTLTELLAVERDSKPSAKITPEIARDIKARLNLGETGRSIAKRHGIHFASVSDIKRGLTWADA